MLGFKLFRKRKDGSYGPLFINAKLKIIQGQEYKAEAHPTKGYQFRPGWHVCSTPSAPHLTEKNRVWCLVEFTHKETLLRPVHQGGVWYLGSTLQIIKELDADRTIQDKLC